MKYLVPIELPLKYAEKWNIYFNDFLTFSDENKPIKIENKKDVKKYRLFRRGGINTYKPNEDFNALLLYKEDFYSDKITKIKKDKPHLASHHVVIDKDGNVILEAKEHSGIYLKGCIAIVENDGYYNLKKSTHYTGYY